MQVQIISNQVDELLYFNISTLNVKSFVHFLGILIDIKQVSDVQVENTVTGTAGLRSVIQFGSSDS